MNQISIKYKRSEIPVYYLDYFLLKRESTSPRCQFILWGFGMGYYYSLLLPFLQFFWVGTLSSSFFLVLDNSKFTSDLYESFDSFVQVTLGVSCGNLGSDSCLSLWNDWERESDDVDTFIMKRFDELFHVRSHASL